MTAPLTATARHPGSLLKELDLDKAQFLALITRAAQLKQDKAYGTERRLLTGRNIALVFEKSSTRTRCAFEVAAHDQGAHVTYLGPDGSHIGREESIRDTARVLGRMFDGIEFRGFAQDTVEQLADHAGVPVWNGLTDTWHPTQMLADVLTMTEHHSGPLEQTAYCFLGDGRNNVARSLLVTGALLGMDVRIAAPRGLWPPRMSSPPPTASPPPAAPVCWSPTTSNRAWRAPTSSTPTYGSAWASPTNSGAPASTCSCPTGSPRRSCTPPASPTRGSCTVSPPSTTAAPSSVSACTTCTASAARRSPTTSSNPPLDRLRPGREPAAHHQSGPRRRPRRLSR